MQTQTPDNILYNIANGIINNKIRGTNEIAQYIYMHLINPGLQVDTQNKKKSRKKAVTDILKSLDIKPIQVPKDMPYEYKSVLIEQNKFGNYEHVFTNFVFKSDSETKYKVYGVQQEDGSVTALNTYQKELCYKYGWFCE